MRIFAYEISLLDIPFSKKVGARKYALKFLRGHINFLRVMDPAEIDYDIINSLLKETVCKPFHLLFFRQLAIIRTTTQSYNHFAGHCYVDNIIAMVFRTYFTWVNDFAETDFAGPLTPRKLIIIAYLGEKKLFAKLH
jgi:hypothetical protein